MCGNRNTQTGIKQKEAIKNMLQR